jgi:hypothetical protein
MVRVLTAAVGLALALPALAQAPQHAPATPPPAAPAAPPGSAPPAGAAAAPASKGPRELEEAKKLGRQGLVKIAPKLGGSRAEKLAKDKGGVVVDRVLDLAAEQAGVKK